jgi:hypothetical protein
MKRSQIILAAIVILMVGGTALALTQIRSGRKLGEPGVKTQPRADSKNLEILLPAEIPGYTSEISTQSETELLKLPSDTSFRVRTYLATKDLYATSGYYSTNRFFSQVSVVMMGSDRSSIHKPQICMTGQGWTIDDNASRQEDIQMDRPFPYVLRVNKIVASMAVEQNGHSLTARGLFVYWFVDADHLTASANQWMLWWLPRDLLLHGVLERWSYISYFTVCPPGVEDAAFGRLKQFIAESAPEYQLVPAANGKSSETSP